MRRPHDIRKKLKDMQNKKLSEEIKEKLRVCPKNCVFNQMVRLNGDNVRVSLCTYGQHPPDKGQPLDISKIITCTTVKQAKECNARIPRYANEEEAKASVAKELSDTQVRVSKYPEIVALEWVLDDHMHNIKQNPRGPWQKLMVWLARFFENRAR